jgi:outer membrane lipoprotein SlyB
MKIRSIALVAAILATLEACGPAGPNRNAAIGAASGGAVGLIAASSAGANSNWTVAATAAGAAVGAVVGQANGARSCTFARPDDPYAVQPC